MAERKDIVACMVACLQMLSQLLNYKSDVIFEELRTAQLCGTEIHAGYGACVSAMHSSQSRLRIAGFAISRRPLKPSPDLPAQYSSTIMSAEMVALSGEPPQLPHPARSIFVSAPIPT